MAPPHEEPKQPEQAPDDSPIVEPPPVTASDIQFPEGFTVNDSLRDEFLGLLNNKELSGKDRAQAFVDLQAKAATALAETQAEQWSTMQTKWQDEAKAEYGERLQPALGRINRLVTEYGNEDLIGVFNLTGAGNNPHMIRFLDKIAGQLTEGEPATGLPKVQEATAAQRLFPSMKG